VVTNLSTSNGHDTVNVGNAGSVQGINENLTIRNPHGLDTLNVDDSADATGELWGLSTNGSDLGAISGPNEGFIKYSLANTSSVNVTTGSGNDTVEVSATGVPTNLSTSGGQDMIEVGNDDTGVQRISATLTIQKSPSHDTIIVNDAVDTVARTAILSTFASGGTNWGSITGLAPAAINYKYADTASVNITTGTGSDTVDVRGTGAATNLTSFDGHDTVNVGNAGSVQGILGALTVRNRRFLTTINIDDSADNATRTATLSAFASGGETFDSITNLAPAAIDFAFENVSSPVNITTSAGRVSWIVSPDARASGTGVVVKDNGLQIN
jgi:hypothetical protein